VSNVIHGHQYLRPSTKAKVEEAIAELGYRPRLAARQLRSGRSNLLTLAIPYISHPYFAGLAHEVVEESERLGYSVLVDETGGLLARERRVARGYRSLLADGIIFSPLALSVDELVAARDSTPMVLLGEHTFNTEIDHVTIDNAGSTRDLTRHLLAGGRTRIAFMGYQSRGTLGTADLRFEGYRQALDEAGIALSPDLIIDAPEPAASAEPRPADGDPDRGAERDYSREEGYQRASQLLDRIGDIDALVCANDMLAIGALRAFRENGVRVPDDVAVVGWDDLPDSSYAAPALTTVAPDLGAIARLALAALHARIQEPDRPHVAEIAPYELIIRQSSTTADTHADKPRPGGPSVEVTLG
jgi:DNA-binding LacI/PurR family transcriptional regulator